MAERLGHGSEVVRISDKFGAVVMQPTSLCNANCEYCYLPSRDRNNVMSVEVASAVSESVREQGLEQPVEIIWHGGEPLATPRGHFRRLVECFEKLRLDGRIDHHIQTNSTLIDDDWCQFFKQFAVKVGISLDGPDWANVQRIDWANRPLYDHIIRGVEALKRNEIPFSVISVVNSRTRFHGRELYDYFAGLGCHNWGINIEEVEGVNAGTKQYLDDDRVKVFWADVFDAWKDNPAIRVRELNSALGYISMVTNETDNQTGGRQIDPFPTVTFSGDVVLLSPELAGIVPVGYNTFVAGNVSSQSLAEIVKGRETHKYVRDYIRGVKKCGDKCAYFEFCGGGQASNKYFEHGRIDVTETAFCRSSKQRLLDAILAKT